MQNYNNFSLEEVKRKKKLTPEEKDYLEQEKEREKMEQYARDREQEDKEFIEARREVLNLPYDRRSHHDLNERRFALFWSCFTRQKSEEISDSVWKDYREISNNFFKENPKRVHVAIIEFKKLFEKYPEQFKSLGQFQQGISNILEMGEITDIKYSKFNK